jgi:methylglutaconyl-CoA hydratase
MTDQGFRARAAAFKTITLDADERGVATLRLNRPERHNALDAAMIAELTEVAALMAASPGLRAVVLTGAGESFCAGGDLNWMRAQFEAPRATRIAEARALAEALLALNTLPKPLIGRVQGQAYGGGIGMMAVCDTVVSVDSARFGLTEVRLGLIPATISPYVIARLGEGMARRVFMSGRRFDAAEAQSLGLVSRVVGEGALDAAVEAEVTPYLAAAPGAVARAKALARSLGPVIDDAVIQRTAEALADAWDDPEAQEGVTAFFERRKPTWMS